jgi:hypothetical protein
MVDVRIYALHWNMDPDTEKGLKIQEWIDWLVEKKQVTSRST